MPSFLIVLSRILRAFVQVRHYHHTKDVGRILEVIKSRLAQLSPAAREEVLTYLSFPHRDE